MGNQVGNKNDNLPTAERQGKANKVEQITPISFEGNNFNQTTPSLLSQSNSNKESGQPSQLSNFTTNQIKKSSIRKETTLNMNQLAVIMENQELFGGKKSEVRIPFQVVKLKIDKKVEEVINALYPAFYRQFDEKTGEEAKWQINSKGYYSKFVEPNRLAILKPGFFYYGQYKQQGADYLPNGLGRLFTEQGIYFGSFSNGQAHGEGTYTQISDSSTCRGTWVNGQMRTGVIENKHYKYKGQFMDGIADGKGVIQFTSHKASYKGNFRHGLYDDQNGYFQCEYYDYSGAFKQGKKEGIGCLIQKQRFIKGKTRRYKPQQQFQGYFQNDYYKGRQKVDK